MPTKTAQPGTYDSRPKKNEVEAGKGLIDRIIRNRTFEPFDKPTIGVDFFIFKRKGDSLEGEICGHAIQNIRRSSSYPIKLEDGTVVEIFANKLLHRLITKNELVFSHVRIVYIGRQQTAYGGHWRKIYRVYKIKGCITQHYEEMSEK